MATDVGKAVVLPLSRELSFTSLLVNKSRLFRWATLMTIGTYMVSTPIIAYYNTQLIGNPNDLPVILAAPGFIGLGKLVSAFESHLLTSSYRRHFIRCLPRKWRMVYQSGT